MTIRVKDADDQNPVFTKDRYRASVSETTKLTVSLIMCVFFLFHNPLARAHKQRDLNKQTKIVNIFLNKIHTTIIQMKC